MNIEIRLKSPGDNDDITRIGKTVALQLIGQAIEIMDDNDAIIWRDWGGLVRLEVADDSQPDPIPIEYFWKDGEWQRMSPTSRREGTISDQKDDEGSVGKGR